MHTLSKEELVHSLNVKADRAFKKLKDELESTGNREDFDRIIVQEYMETIFSVQESIKYINLLP